ncbi:hypothetical protein [Leadbetterella sp. DM7]|uniref:hypothetical protein n=1 Tax=Leadbetterella sp. DM7 TaxID=3235085 RepID=UPI00349EF963
MTLYHTQEKRKNILAFPLLCIRDDAWLGEAFYFWKEESDAHDWGHNSKRATGYFEVYACDIHSNSFLDTVFNETHYNFWIKQLEKIAKKILVKTHEKPTLKELNDYIKDRHVWPQIDYIQFQDLPANQEKSFVKPITYRHGKKRKVRTVAFRKRIQIAVYNHEIISNFVLKASERVI